MLRDAAQATQFREGPGRDLTDVTHEAAFTAVELTCSYRKDQLEVALQISFVAERGPAGADKANFPFFVAVVDSQQNILAKEVFDSEVEFEEGRRRTGIREEIDQRITLRSNESGADYEALVGFQLSQEQLARNRRRRGG